jgi:integrase/recombinase XerD
VDYGHLKESPIPQDVASHRSLYLPHALTEAEVQSILDEADGTDPAGLRDRAILETLYATGMRVSELTGLTLADLHLGEGFAFITGKGGHQRLVPVGQYAIDALGAYLRTGRTALCPRAGGRREVFLTQRGPISRATVFRVVKKYAALAGIRDVSPHTFRHSCASHMLAHGADLRLVQELLGHASLTTTQIYTHVEMSRLREVYDRAHPLA